MKLTTGISSNYVQGWDVVKALRELIQNNLDSRQEFGCFGRILWRNGFATISDSGPGLEMKHLALGYSEKSALAKGKFGEGLKLALLVLSREGRQIEIHSKDSIVRPAIEHNEGYGIPILVLNIDQAPRSIQGTVIRVACSKEELEEAKKYFIEFEEKKEQFQWLEKGKISTPGGYIYINGTKVGRLENAKFSYHLSGKIDIGNRDREVIDAYKVRPYIREMLRDTTSHTVLRQLFQAATTRESAAETQIGIDLSQVSKETRKRWNLVLRKTFNFSKTLISDGDHGDDFEATQLGYQVLVVWDHSWEMAMRMAGMRGTRSVVKGEKAANVGRVAMKNLTDIEKTNLRKAKRLIKKHYGPVGAIRIIEKLTGLAANDDAVNGYYDRETDRIFLTRKILVDEAQTLHTLLHESVHKHTGFGDNTREFEQALLDVAVGMMLRGGKKVKHN
jgi:hypothetical protein